MLLRSECRGRNGRYSGGKSRILEEMFIITVALLIKTGSLRLVPFHDNGSVLTLRRNKMWKWRLEHVYPNSNLRCYNLHGYLLSFDTCYTCTPL